ncbi:MAG: butyrate kinase [bacterium]
MEKKYRVLAINPGSTSTKVAVYDDEELIMQENIHLSAEDLAPFTRVIDEYEMRKGYILKLLDAKGITLDSIDAVSCRGGGMKPVSSGTIAINETMLDDIRASGGGHASVLGPLIGDELSRQLGIPAFTVDPTSVDEFEDIARISGWPELPRRSGFHPLNHKAVARKAAKELGKKYEELNLVVAHIGGGVSIGAHKKGRIIDVNIGEGGLFTPERACPPVGAAVRLAFSGKYTEREMIKMMLGNGGLQALLGTKDMREVERRVKEGDKEAELAFKAMCYQIAKAIGALSTVLKGEVDAIVLTGGCSHSKLLTDEVSGYVKYIAPIMVFPGEKEMESLAFGVLRVLRGEEKAKVYPC